MRIAIIGTRGIPANYGGFETFAEKLSIRLVASGHEVTVYGRSHFIKTTEKVYHGVRLVVLPTINHKYLDTPAHTLLATLHVMLSRYDLVLFCNAANSFLTFWPRLIGQKVVLNVDGLEWKRAKWNRFGQAVYRFSEMLATFMPDWIVTDAKDIQKYYFQKFGKKSTYIPYGTPISRLESTAVLKKFDLKKRGYILYVSRLEPENNAHTVIKAYEKVKTKMPLVIVGDAPYSSDYIAGLRKTRDPRIIFTGYVFGQGYREFQSHAYCYIQATEVGGTHPALVEAMGHGNCILANDVPEHREVLEETGLYFSVRDLNGFTQKIQYLIDHPEVVKRHRALTFRKAEEEYDWGRITSAYESLFYTIKRGAV